MPIEEPEVISLFVVLTFALFLQSRSLLEILISPSSSMHGRSNELATFCQIVQSCKCMSSYCAANMPPRSGVWQWLVQSYACVALAVSL